MDPQKPLNQNLKASITTLTYAIEKFYNELSSINQHPELDNIAPEYRKRLISLLGQFEDQTRPLFIFLGKFKSFAKDMEEEREAKPKAGEREKFEVDRKVDYERAQKKHGRAYATTRDINAPPQRAARTTGTTRDVNLQEQSDELQDLINQRSAYMDKAEALQKKRDMIEKYSGKLPPEKLQRAYDEFNRQKSELEKVRTDLENRRKELNRKRGEQQIGSKMSSPQTKEEYIQAKASLAGDMNELKRLKKQILDANIRSRKGERVEGVRELSDRFYKMKAELEKRKKHLDALGVRFK